MDYRVLNLYIYVVIKTATSEGGPDPHYHSLSLSLLNNSLSYSSPHGLLKSTGASVSTVL